MENKKNFGFIRNMKIQYKIGSGFLFPTTFEKEVFSDLTGERGILMGAFYGLMQAAYSNLRSSSTSSEEAIKHTVEMITIAIIKIVCRVTSTLVTNFTNETLK